MKKSLICLSIFTSLLYSQETVSQHFLNNNMTHNFDTSSLIADELDYLITDGRFYNRLRTNTFIFNWPEEIEGSRENHSITGIGGSSIFKSAYHNGFGFTAGLWFTTGVGSLELADSNLYKAGKDTFSRYNASLNNKPYLYSFAERYIEYKDNETNIKLGRQIFESLLTRSNDTKMIPNTFYGAAIESSILKQNKLKFGYFTMQKLRDHSDFHSVLAYEDSSEEFSKYLGNDDSAMHKGLLASKLEENNINDKLIIFELKNSAFDNVDLSANFTIVPELLSFSTLEANFNFNFNDILIKPGFRYLVQYDNGAGSIGGSNIKNDTTGYKDPDSLDSHLIGAKINFKKDRFKFKIGFTQVADKGDIVAPWRGFPTGGYTRAMGQYNWQANTQTTMFEADYKFKDIDNLRVKGRVALQDFDDNKSGAQADSNVYTLDISKKFNHFPLYFKTRIAHVVGDDNTTVDTPEGAIVKNDSSYDEFRFEFNYLF